MIEIKVYLSDASYYMKMKRKLILTIVTICFFNVSREITATSPLLTKNQQSIASRTQTIENEIKEVSILQIVVEDGE